MSSVAKLGMETLKEILEKETVNGVLNIQRNMVCLFAGNNGWEE